MLRAYVKGTGNSGLSSQSAIFVINKWDRVCSDEKSEEERQQYLDLAAEQIKIRWPGFRKEQLLTMNSKRALLFQTFGITTPDLSTLCDSIKQMLPKALENRIKRLQMYVKTMYTAYICFYLWFLQETNPPNELCRASIGNNNQAAAIAC